MFDQCDSNCKNNRICIELNKSICSVLNLSLYYVFVGSTGLCCDNNAINEISPLLITFGSGSDHYSNINASDFNFSTSHQQVYSSLMHDRQFAFVNAVPASYDTWHAQALDHTVNDTHGYMYLVIVGEYGSQIFNSTVNGLLVGRQYEFSAYLANLIKHGKDLTRPNIRFEVRSNTNNNDLIAEYNTSDIPEYGCMTWKKYGLSFNAPNSSVVLSMISNALDSHGNDLAIDDIELRLCSIVQSHPCVPGESISIF